MHHTDSYNFFIFFFFFFLPEDSEILHKLKLSSIYKKSRSVLNKSEAAAVRSMRVNIFTICLYSNFEVYSTSPITLGCLEQIALCNYTRLFFFTPAGCK